MRKRRKRRRSSKPRHNSPPIADTRTRTEKFLRYAQTQLLSHKATTSPFRRGASSWTYRVTAGKESMMSILFTDDHIPGSVRVEVNNDTHCGHVAFLSAKPQLLGSRLYAVNGNPEEEGNQLLETFLAFVDEGASFATVFTEIASLIAAGSFAGITLDERRSVAENKENTSPIERSLRAVGETGPVCYLP